MTATAAVGTAWSKAPFLLGNLIQRADQAIYVDKQQRELEKSPLAGAKILISDETLIILEMLLCL